MPLVRNVDVQVVEECTPRRVGAEDGVSEAGRPAVDLGEERPRPVARGEPRGPHGQPVTDDIAVEERVRVGASIVTLPALGVQRGDCSRIGGAGGPHGEGPHRQIVIRATPTPPAVYAGERQTLLV